MPFSQRLARELVRRRTEAGLTQDQLAAKAGLKSQNQLSLLERNIPDGPNFADLVRLGATLGLTPNHLASLGGWWTPPEEQAEIDPKLAELLRDLQSLRPAHRAALIETMYRLLLAYRIDEGKEMKGD